MAKTQEVYHLVQRQEFIEIITHTVYKTGGGEDSRMYVPTIPGTQSIIWLF